jgi:hypothetical protein
MHLLHEIGTSKGPFTRFPVIEILKPLVRFGAHLLH